MIKGMATVGNEIPAVAMPLTAITILFEVVVSFKII